jgi:hypothetical protein
MARMFESVRQPGELAPAADIGEAISRQREMLTDLLTVSMFKAARRLAPLIDIRHALELLLIDEIEHLRYCRNLYVLDTAGNQITANIGRDGVDRSHYARNRAGRDYMRNIIGVSDFRLSEVYFSENSTRPSITAIQVMRDRSMQRAGFLGADFDLRELPHTGAIYSELQQWRQLRGDPAIRGGLFSQCREDSVIDRRLGDVLSLLHELMAERGVFHGKLHFSSNRATVWLTDDPFRYRLLGLDELASPDTCLAYPRRPYPDTAQVPAEYVLPVLEHFRMLRQADENIYLRSGSLNIFNGTVGLNFSCDGSHYMNFREFLGKDAQFWFGMRCAV